jgi:hypothetical protein
MKMNQFLFGVSSIIICAISNGTFRKSTESSIEPSRRPQMNAELINACGSISYSQHIVILNKCKSFEENVLI